MKINLFVALLGIILSLGANAEPTKLNPANRLELWEFIIGGQGTYDQLYNLNPVKKEDSSDTDNEKLFSQLKVLKKFIDSFDFAKMKVNNSFSCSNDSTKSYAWSISETGKQYAFYIHHDDHQGKYNDQISFKIPAGSYRADWVNPLNGSTIRSEYFSVKKDKHSLTTPEYTNDIALRIIRIL